MEKRKRSYRFSSIIYLVCVPIWAFIAYLNRGDTMMYFYIVLAVACLAVGCLQYTMSKRL